MGRTAPTADPLRLVCAQALRGHRERARKDRQSLDYGLCQLEALARKATACCYCGALLSAGTVAFDHKVPTSRVADYSLANLAVVCIPCNSAKGLLTAEEYVQLRSLLKTWHPRAGNDLLARLRAGGKRYRLRGQRP